MAQLAAKDGIEFVPMQWSKCALLHSCLGICALPACCLARTAAACGLPQHLCCLPAAAATLLTLLACIACKLLSALPRLARFIVQVEHCRPGQAHGLPPAGQPRAAGVQRGAKILLGERCAGSHAMHAHLLLCLGLGLYPGCEPSTIGCCRLSPVGFTIRPTCRPGCSPTTAGTRHT